MASFRFEYSEEEKAKLEAFAESQGVSKAKVICWLISKLPGEELPKAPRKEPSKRGGHKLRISLTDEQYQALCERTALDKWQSPSAWVYSLVISQARDMPVLTDDEREALREAAFQLRRLGTNMNQITKAVNQDPRSIQHREAINFTAVAELVNEIGALAENIQLGAVKRWGL